MFLLGLFAFPLLLVAFIYLLQSKFINSFNELVNGTETFLALVPIVRIYILGKLVGNKLAGSSINTVFRGELFIF